MIVAVIASPGNPANATSGGAVSAGTVFGADQSIGQVSTSDQTESTYQPVHISDEYALQKIEQTFGPEVAASLNYRATKTTQSVGDRVTRATEVSTGNWCGYLVLDPNANSVRADFNVCKTTTTNAMDFTWVGLAGTVPGSNNLIQAGYCMRSGSSSCKFKAFYELLPDGPQYIDDFSIHIGDDLGATVQRDWLYGANYYYVCVFNETTGYYFADVFPYAPSPMSANWVTETPSGWKIGTWNGGSYGPTEYFWDAYWWDAANPYVTYGITQGAQFWHMKMNTGAPYNEHMTATYQSATSFYCQKTST
jgi:hypothetical protein